MVRSARYPRPLSWHEIRGADIQLLLRRTGCGLDTWNRRVRESGIADQGSLRAWLTEQGVTGYPQMLLVMERFGYPDYLTANANELVDGQYADRPALRPVLDGVLVLLPVIGGATVQAR